MAKGWEAGNHEEWVDFEVKHLVVLDGTWRKANRMYHENPWLKLLPHLQLDPSNMSLYSEICQGSLAAARERRDRGTRDIIHWDIDGVEEPQDARSVAFGARDKVGNLGGGGKGFLKPAVQAKL
ncbi:hypothetical protein NE237_032888 [Protea cynaroides]|uniref:tRNA-uridine aminocarboxypropyltransferase n=1 Tax=Protea cynaroides TaxID=273540 RepID=A0A9Q0L4V0_9MAGN|nr:hypothetical protein NE237_032888 [Protea cynaroides]